MTEPNTKRKYPKEQLEMNKKFLKFVNDIHKPYKLKANSGKVLCKTSCKGEKIKLNTKLKEKAMKHCEYVSIANRRERESEAIDIALSEKEYLLREIEKLTRYETERMKEQEKQWRETCNVCKDKKAMIPIMRIKLQEQAKQIFDDFDNWDITMESLRKKWLK